MKNRFWGRSEPWSKEAGVIVITVVYSNYYFALKKEVERIKSEELVSKG